MPVYYLEIIVVVVGLLMLMVDAFVKLEDKRSIAWIGMLGLLVVFGLLFKVEWPESTAGAFWQFYTSEDKLALYFKGIALLTTLVVLVMAVDHAPTVIEQTAQPCLRMRARLVAGGLFDHGGSVVHRHYEDDQGC